MTASSREDEARAADCWFGSDNVPRDRASTDWKRLARLRQAGWRVAQGYPIGTNPYRGGGGSTRVGNRLALDFAKTSGANFITPAALAAVRARLDARERHEMLDEGRLWANLLSSMPLCFNLFGDLAGDPEQASRAVNAWWPSAPNGTITVRFEHSPSRRDTTYLGNNSAFDVAFEIDPGNGARGIIGVETKYHEHAIPERKPKDVALRRYTAVTERSGIFVDGWETPIIGTELQQVWLDHLLVLSMLQHETRQWSWARFVLVYPAENPSFARVAAAYRRVLRDASTFEALTLETLLDAPLALPTTTREAVRRRYLDSATAEEGEHIVERDS